MITPEQHRNAIVKLLAKLSAERHYGNVIITLKDGNIVMIKQEETTPPDILVQEMLSVSVRN